jgi:hypothetical protein
MTPKAVLDANCRDQQKVVRDEYGYNGIQVFPPEIILNAFEMKNIEISLFFIQGKITSSSNP